MPRKPREHQVARSVIFHVLNRGVLKQTIFHGEEDFATFVNVVRQSVARGEVRVYHWCLMPNHYHLVLEIMEPGALSRLVARWQQVYAIKYHKRHNTAGRLFQGRFKSQAIDKEGYLLACGRYVEQNPVRAGLCGRAWDWPWSSAKFYVEGRADGLTTCDPMWGERDRSQYERWLEERSEEYERMFASGTDVIGRDGFRHGLVRKDGRLVLRGRGRRPVGKIKS
ncbi:MAG: hypothetical protein FJ272_11275 [Planctomycetes bacterium]|nr:hypothetical protein [Planctomycetota bacterium]